MTTVFLLVCTVCVLAPLRAEAQERLLYRESTAGEVVLVDAAHEASGRGTILRVSRSNGETCVIVSGASQETTWCGYDSLPLHTAYHAVRVGAAIRLEGLLNGRPLSRTIDIDSRPWCQFIERSLAEYAISGSSQPVTFWILLPADAAPVLLVARRQGQELVEVNGRSVAAERVRVSLTGLVSMFWSMVYWYRSTDGTFVRFEGVRGFPGSPKMVVELVRDCNAGP